GWGLRTADRLAASARHRPRRKGGRQMSSKLAIGATVLAVVAVALVTAAVVAGPNIASPMQVHVIEHATSDTLVDTGAAGDTSGDLLTFHNPVFDASDTK